MKSFGRWKFPTNVFRPNQEHLWKIQLATAPGYGQKIAYNRSLGISIHTNSYYWKFLFQSKYQHLSNTLVFFMAFCLNVDSNTDDSYGIPTPYLIVPFQCEIIISHYRYGTVHLLMCKWAWAFSPVNHMWHFVRDGLIGNSESANMLFF